MKNPTYSFYAKLLTLLQDSSFNESLAKQLVGIYESSEGSITLEDVTFENLKEWHSQLPDESGLEKTEEITGCAFKDLASQMRSERVRALHKEWKDQAGVPDDLYVHLRRSKDLGDGVATATVVTDDIEAFRHFFQQGNFNMRGEVRLSESEEV